jgi:hypothetical protein
MAPGPEKVSWGGGGRVPSRRSRHPDSCAAAKIWGKPLDSLGEISEYDTQFECLTCLDTEFYCLSKTDTMLMNSLKRRDSPLFLSSTYGFAPSFSFPIPSPPR